MLDLATDPVTTNRGIGLPVEGPPAPVSVIIPARNAALTIVTTLQSLIPDGDLIREILIVDDGSSDSTAAIAAAAARQLDLPLTLFHVDFSNPGAARNAGIDRAKGDFIYFLDADDEVLPGGLRQLVRCLSGDRSIDIAVGGYVRRVNCALDKSRWPTGFRPRRSTNARNYLTNHLRSIAMGSALITRRAAKMARFPETLAYDEDTLFWATVLSRADVGTVPHAIVVYNIVESRMTLRFTSAPRRQFLRISKELDRLTDVGIEESTLRWRKGWMALRTVRALIHERDFAAATEFMRAASAAHVRIRWSATMLRYVIRIRVGIAAHHLGL